METPVIAADLACDQEDNSNNGRSSQESSSDQKQQEQDVRQPIIPPSVSVLCSTCAEPQCESEWNFSIEDGVPIKNNKSNASFKTGDLMKDKAGQGQKMWKNKGRVIYRPGHVLYSP